MLRRLTKETGVIAPCIALALLALMVGPTPLTRRASSKVVATNLNLGQGGRDRDYKCVQRTAKAKPPQRLSPKFRGTGKYSQQA